MIVSISTDSYRMLTPTIQPSTTHSIAQLIGRVLVIVVTSPRIRGKSDPGNQVLGIVAVIAFVYIIVSECVWSCRCEALLMGL